MSALIEARGLCVGYGDATVVRDLDLKVEAGEVVALLGANGAGKTTTLMALAGELVPQGGELIWQGGPPPPSLHRRVRQGLGYVTEERSAITRLTAKQNLLITRDGDFDKAIDLFPALKPLLSRRAGLLSGGEQQMLILARVLSRPTKLLLADELSLGLAPAMVDLLLEAVRRAATDGMGAIIVEQHVHKALRIADRVYVLRQGRVRFAGTSAEALERLPKIESEYLSMQRQELS
jgi:ABC-type branched-subunit amino acid transport system ATPase component